jgi:hypothetical protein
MTNSFFIGAPLDRSKLGLPDFGGNRDEIKEGLGFRVCSIISIISAVWNVLQKGL